MVEPVGGRPGEWGCRGGFWEDRYRGPFFYYWEELGGWIPGSPCPVVLVSGDPGNQKLGSSYPEAGHGGGRWNSGPG